MRHLDEFLHVIRPLRTPVTWEGSPCRRRRTLCTSEQLDNTQLLVASSSTGLRDDDFSGGEVLFGVNCVNCANCANCANCTCHETLTIMDNDAGMNKSRYRQILAGLRRNGFVIAKNISDKELTFMKVV